MELTRGISSIESSVPLQLEVRPRLAACRVLLCASQDTGHAEPGGATRSRRKGRGEEGVDPLVSVAREGSMTSPHVLDVSRAPGSALSTGRSPSCTCGPGSGRVPPSASLPSKSVRKR